MLHAAALADWNSFIEHLVAFIPYQAGPHLAVATKQMDLDKQRKKDLIINEILVVCSSQHPNTANYIDSFLYKNDLWAAIEYMEGGSLTDVVIANLMSEGQIAAMFSGIGPGTRALASTRSHLP